MNKQIAQQVALQANYMTDWQRTFDYGNVKLLSEASGKLVSPPDKLRRLNDFLAAAYTHSIALYADSGDDCVDQYGHAIELKLAFIKARDFRIGAQGRAIVTGPSATSLSSAINAKFRVYEGTAADHHSKDTALVLMSLEHNCFITGFMMTGTNVQKIVHSDTRSSVQRDISLAAFIRDGHEFGSSAPHIGWETYYDALFNYLQAKEGRITGKEATLALDRWASFADDRNLQRL